MYLLSQMASFCILNILETANYAVLVSKHDVQNKDLGHTGFSMFNSILNKFILMCLECIDLKLAKSANSTEIGKEQ